jgi:hypothetical protein
MPHFHMAGNMRDNDANLCEGLLTRWGRPDVSRPVRPNFARKRAPLVANLHSCSVRLRRSVHPAWAGAASAVVRPILSHPILAGSSLATLPESRRVAEMDAPRSSWRRRWIMRQLPPRSSPPAPMLARRATKGMAAAQSEGPVLREAVRAIRFDRGLLLSCW